ncbi:hypothetical protein HZH66_006789 [Vespula vulgaris]|uniref:Uncharacterized protein n=1 Tax=Vespula vulgaris TaxID=7454 RepID=A0A834K3U6_VESVU|nr:hypothetical protein HZH66_006789 [Vespula vulgaris]
MRKTRAKTRKHHFLKVVEGRRSEVPEARAEAESTPYFDVKRRSNIALDKLVSETESQHRDGPVMDNDESTGREVKKKTQKRDVKTGNQ